MHPKRNLLIDGRIVRKWLFVRESPIDRRPVLVAVEAFDLDHALTRLREKFHWVEKRAWHMVEELDAEHFVGALGEDLPLVPKGAIVVQSSRTIN
jgi:hypothetical protein